MCLANAFGRRMVGNMGKGKGTTAKGMILSGRVDRTVERTKPGGPGKKDSRARERSVRERKGGVMETEKKTQSVQPLLQLPTGRWKKEEILEKTDAEKKEKIRRHLLGRAKETEGSGDCNRGGEDGER